MKKKYIKIIIVILSLVLFDQVVKHLVINYLDSSSIVIIKNFLEFVFVKNTGAAFGMFNNSTFFLTIVTIFFIIFLIKEIKNNFDNKKMLVALILIVSGSIGNLIDRIFLKYVVDFISFKLYNYQMPVFNIADMLITFGVCIYIYCLLKEDKNERNKSK